MKITAYNDELPLVLSGAGGIVATNYSRTSLGSNTPLIESGVGSPGTGPQAAAWDHVHPEFSSGSSSFGSNSTRVASAPSAGASSSNSRADHIHDGIGTVTASSSNSLNRGIVNLRAGSGIAFALSNTDGGSGLDTVTITNIAASSGGGGGGGSPTTSYVGHNSVGASTDTPGVNSKGYAKKVTFPSTGILLSIGAHVAASSNTIANGPSVGLLTDNSGVPGRVVAYAPALNMRMDGVFRWVDVPLGALVTATDYWLVVRTSDLGGAALLQMKFDNSGGTDRTGTIAAASMYDWGSVTAQSATVNRYSIRGLFMPTT